MQMKSKLAALAASVCVLVVTGPVFADQGYGYGDHPMMWGEWFAGPMMMLFMIAVLVVAVVVVLKVAGIGASSGNGGQSDALAILNERYARGEIDKAEYEERKSVLGA